MNIINPYRFGLKSGLAFVYQLTETSGDVIDSVRANNGTNNGCTVNQTGKILKSYRFTEASKNYLSLPNHALWSATDGVNEQGMSISLWVYYIAGDKYDGFLTKRGGGYTEWQLIIADPYFAFEMWTADLSGYLEAIINIPFSTLNWYHVVCTYDGSKSHGGIKLYKNGALLTTTNTTLGTYVGAVNTPATVEVGKYGWGDGGYLNGNVEQIAFWNRALTVGEIARLYNSGNGLAYASWM